MIYIISIILTLLIIYLIGYYSKEKEFKDIWGKNKTMEVKKSQKLHNEWKKNYYILVKFQDFYYMINRCFELPGYFYRKVKYFIQRAINGYAECDVWNFYSYHTDIMIDFLDKFIKQVHGCPSGILKGNTEDDKIFEECQEKWKYILNEIKWTFEMAKKIDKFNYIMSQEENKRYKQGWKYFQKYYFSLWD